MPTRTYRLAVGGVLSFEALLLAWNAWRFDWLRGYDAYANDLYAAVVAGDLRLPSESESGTWHTPPLWFALAGLLRRLADAVGGEEVQRPGQLLAAIAGLAVCVLVLLIARELWPERRLLHVLALVFAATTPALVRASAMYHPETLAVALATGGVLAALRALRGAPSVAACVASGALLGLAGLTRAWALPVLAAVVAVVAVEAGRRRVWGPPLALAGVALALLLPWHVNQQVAHGSAFAFNREPPEGSIFDRRPASFYLGPRVLRVFDHPITPLFRNELVPHLYADWWGDWGLTWDSPPPPAPAELLPSNVVAERARQSAIGVVPTAFALAGLLALAALAVGGHSLRLGLLPLTAAAVALAYLVFAVRYPSTDGDTIKATYLLMALPPAAVGAGFVVDTLKPAGRRGDWIVTAALVALLAMQLPFLIL